MHCKVLPTILLKSKNDDEYDDVDDVVDNDDPHLANLSTLALGGGISRSIIGHNIGIGDLTIGAA